MKVFYKFSDSNILQGECRMGGARNDLMESKIQTILIIEDSPTNDEVFRSILGKNFQLLFASGRMDVLELVGQNDIDLVLLDNDIPSVGVGEICANLNTKVANRNTQIILMVKKEQESNLEDLPVGVADCIAKPLQPLIVMARLQRHLELKEYHDLWEGATTVGYSVGVGSQWEFDFLLSREWQRALRNQTPISLILIDIDFFKELKSHGGRPTGDDCLRLVEESLRECVKRDLDFIARHKKYAFVCLLPDTDTDGAQRVCQLIREKVVQLNIPHPSSPIADRVTLSIGSATVRPTFKLGQDYLLHQAEVLLENARSCDHNQTRSWQS
jgi:diguanylate cyclase (GGDEF)-like protein